MSSPIPTPGELLLVMHRKLAERSREVRLRNELSVSQFEVLWFVASEGSVPMDAIAKHLSIKPPSATALITALEKKAMITRRQDPEDRRVVNVILTPQAKRQLASLKKQKDHAFESLLGTLSAADRKEFTRLLILLTED